MAIDFATDELIAIRSAMIIEREDAVLSAQWPTSAPKQRQKLLLRAWGYVRGTNAWVLGDRAYDALNAEERDAHAYWCWYTALAIDLCAKVRALAADGGIVLPQSGQAFPT